MGDDGRVKPMGPPTWEHVLLLGQNIEALEKKFEELAEVNMTEHTAFIRWGKTIANLGDWRIKTIDAYEKIASLENKIAELEKKLVKVERTANHRHSYISPPVYGRGMMDNRENGF